MVSAGILQTLDCRALDSRRLRPSNSMELGGLLQSAIYLAGLNGGIRLVESLYINNFTTVTALRDNTDGSVWQFGNRVHKPSDQSGIQILDKADYYTTLLKRLTENQTQILTRLSQIYGKNAADSRIPKSKLIPLLGPANCYFSGSTQTDSGPAHACF